MKKTVFSYCKHNTLTVHPVLTGTGWQKGQGQYFQQIVTLFYSFSVQDEFKTAEEKEILKKHSVILDPSTQLEKVDIAQRGTQEKAESTRKEKLVF